QQTQLGAAVSHVALARYDPCDCAAEIHVKVELHGSSKRWYVARPLEEAALKLRQLLLQNPLDAGLRDRAENAFDLHPLPRSEVSQLRPAALSGRRRRSRWGLLATRCARSTR